MAALHPGQRGKLSASEWNRHSRAADQVEAGRRTGISGVSGVAVQGEIIRIRNDTGADITVPHGIVGVGDPIYSPDTKPSEYSQYLWHKGVLPSDDYAGQFAILLSPVRAGKLTRALIGGILSGVKVTGDGGYAEINASGADHAAKTGMLKAGATGAAKILWSEAGTGERLATVQLGGVGNSAALYITTTDIQPDGTISITPADVVSGQVQAAAGASAITVNAWEY